MPNSLKALALIAMGLFLYSRYFTGALLYYINQRFVWLTVLASLGFILVGASYRYRTEYLHDHDPDHADHQHGRSGWLGLLLILLPMALGLLIPPQPLGAAAMSNRDVSLKALTSAAPAPGGVVLSKPKSENNILDWVMAFQSNPDLSSFEGQAAAVTGFVYRDQRLAADEFMVSRFIISCCAADAAPLGLVVRSPQAVELPTDQWVAVRGHFEPGQLDGDPVPILVAADITPVEVPEQPYLYPY
jgi:uncharacterized repeat protein (TIGR03943 family)